MITTWDIVLMRAIGITNRYPAEHQQMTDEQIWATLDGVIRQQQAALRGG